MVKAAYGSGKPAYGVGAGNATVVVDETADLADAARNTRISKTQNHGSGCSCDGNLLVEATVYDRLLDALAEGRRLPAGADEKTQARGGDVGRRRAPHARHGRASGARHRGEGRLSRCPRASRSSSCKEDQIGKAHRFSGEKLSPVLAIFKYEGFDNLLEMVSAIFEVGGKGHSLRHRVVRRRPHSPTGVDGAGQPHHGASAERQRAMPGRSPTACR